LVGWSLLGAVEQTRARAELDARSNARELARGLLAALRAPAILDQTPTAARFAVRNGALQIPDDVGWLRTEAPLPADAVVAEKLRQAQVDEFVRNDPTAARQQFDALLGPLGPTGDAALPVIAAAAWQAQRCGACASAGELAARLAAAFDAAAPARLADPTQAHILAAAALLDAALSRPRAPFAARLLPALPADLAQATLARLRERGEDTAALEAAASATAARRDLLATIADLQASLPATPLAAKAAGQLLLWFPKDDKNGDGALLPKAFLQQLRSTVPGRGDLLFATPPADADEVVAGFAWIAPEPLPPPSLLARPAAVIGATSLLVLVFAASAFFMVRALRREALAMRARAEFLTGVTHELKTPVASIRLMAEVLTGDEVPPPKQREYFALLAGESARLSMLIENVLDLGQMERGERAYDPRPCDAAAVVREAVTLFAPLAQRSGLRLELHSDDAPAPATLDAGACVQALLNLLDNARKYAATGQRIDVTTSRAAGTFAIHVRDFGPGVPATERDAIFERFARGSAHRHGSIPGVGLGLHLSRAIVQRHGGTLRCDAPADGPGALFTLTLPLDPEPAP
jgi:signal transduction histidine kinase